VSGFGLSRFGVRGFGVGHTRMLVNDAPVVAPGHLDAQLLRPARVRRRALVFVAARAPVLPEFLTSVRDLRFSLGNISRFMT